MVQNVGFGHIPAFRNRPLTLQIVLATLPKSPGIRIIFALYNIQKGRRINQEIEPHASKVLLGVSHVLAILHLRVRNIVLGTPTSTDLSHGSFSRCIKGRISGIGTRKEAIGALSRRRRSQACHEPIVDRILVDQGCPVSVRSDGIRKFFAEILIEWIPFWSSIV